MISINFNPLVSTTQRSINTANRSISQALLRMSTGCRINSAADDVAGFYAAKGINSQLRSLAVTSQNVESGINFMQTATGGLSSMNSVVNRLNELALMGSSGSLTQLERTALQNESDELLEQLFSLRDDTKFNKINVFGTEKVATSAFSTPPPESKTALRKGYSNMQLTM